MEASELVWRVYADNRTDARHHETQRSTVTSVLLAIASAITAVAGVQWRAGASPHWSLGLLLLLVGAVGVLFTRTLYERCWWHVRRGEACLQWLAQAVPDAGLHSTLERADAKHQQQFGADLDTPLGRLWYGPHIAVVVLGLLLIILPRLVR